MDYFKDFDNQDLIDVQTMTGHEWNDFVHDHHYGVCSACGCEWKYEDMPILTDENWKKAVAYFGLTDSDEIGKAKVFKVGSAESKLNRINTLLVPIEDSVLLCPHCMEIALGHSLTRDDLNDCGFTDNYIRTHKLQ